MLGKEAVRGQERCWVRQNMASSPSFRPEMPMWGILHLMAWLKGMPRRVVVSWGLVVADFYFGLLCLLAINFQWILGEGRLALLSVLWGTIAAFPFLVALAAIITHRSR